jgi:hypothetical protein
VITSNLATPWLSTCQKNSCTTIRLLDE